jgi:anti-sigma factor RsiW
MTHPKPEEFIPLLFGEADAATRQMLEAHLAECPECQQRTNAWRNTTARLDSWRVPKMPRRSVRVPAQPLAWAAAAAIMIGAFVAGRWTAPSSVAPKIDVAALRAELKADLANEFHRSVAELSAASSNALADIEFRLATANAAHNKDLASEFVQVIDAMRAQDREATEALFAKLQKQYTTDFVLLRRDLETLASTTDEEIETARQKLIELAAARSDENL